MLFFNHAIAPLIRRNIIFPFYWNCLRRAKVLKYYQALRNQQWNSLEQNQKIQQKRLFNLVNYASQNILYYQKVINEGHIKFSEESIFEDLKKFPLLTKDIIRKNFHGLYKLRDKTYYKNTSGGSTGEPVVFYQDKHYLEWAIANKYLFNEWAGRKIGESMVKIWGSLRDTLRGAKSFKGHIRQQLTGITVLNSNRMTEKILNDYVKKINRVKPRLILSYSSSIDELTRFIKERNLSVYSPCAVMSTAGVLYPEVRERIIEVFRAKVFNRYGSREVSDIACNCEKSEGLHLNTFIHYLEIVDDDGRVVEPGNPGNIVLTLLTNYTMPLIRYKIGDRGILSAEQSHCGHGYPTLKKVSGRIKSVLINRDGDLVDDDTFITLFRLKENVKQFQFIQESIDYMVVNLVLKDKEILKDINAEFKEESQAIKKVMGENTVIQFNIVNEIKPSPSGKFMYVFSKVSKQKK